MAMTGKQIVILGTGIGSAVVLVLSDLLADGITVPHITAGVLALVSSILGAINQYENTQSS
jgi:hypothetical protein